MQIIKQVIFSWDFLLVVWNLKHPSINPSIHSESIRTISREYLLERCNRSVTHHYLFLWTCERPHSQWPELRIQIKPKNLNATQCATMLKTRCLFLLDCKMCLLKAFFGQQGLNNKSDEGYLTVGDFERYSRYIQEQIKRQFAVFVFVMHSCGKPDVGKSSTDFHVSHRHFYNQILLDLNIFVWQTIYINLWHNSLQLVNRLLLSILLHFHFKTAPSHTSDQEAQLYCKYRPVSLHLFIPNWIQGEWFTDTTAVTKASI